MSVEQRNILKYVLWAVAGFAGGCILALIPQLNDPTMPPINYRIVIAAGLSAMMTAVGGYMLPRGGSAGIAAQVDTLRANQVHRSDMVVLPLVGQGEARASSALDPQSQRYPVTHHDCRKTAYYTDIAPTVGSDTILPAPSPNICKACGAKLAEAYRQGEQWYVDSVQVDMP